MGARTVADDEVLKGSFSFRGDSDLDGNPRDREFEAIDGIARKLNISDS